MDSWFFFWLFLTLLCLVTEAFYAGMEMAIVSFNKMRLQYYISKDNRRAKWLNWLLQHPSRLFGTTLLGVNMAMQLGSECSRQVYMAIGLPADFAPITQIFLVLIFAELAPIFSARRCPEHLSLAGSAFIYLSAKALTPVIWAISGIAHAVNWIVGGKIVRNEGFISRDELEVILEMRDKEHLAATDAEDLNLVARNIFTLRDKNAVDAMVPLNTVRCLPSNGTAGHMRRLLSTTLESYIPVFHRDPTNIVGIAFARDLVKTPDGQRARDFARSPWFITSDTNLIQILQQFRRNKQTVAVVLNNQGRAIGLLSLYDVVEELFPQIAMPTKRPVLPTITIDRVFSGHMTVRDFNTQFNVLLEAPEDLTLAQVVEQGCGHHAEVGESITIGRFHITVEESSLLEITRVRICTR